MAIASGQPILSSDVGQFRGSQDGALTVVFAATASQTASFTFTTPFAVTPNLVCQVVSGAGSAIKSFVLVTVLSATGFTVRVDLAASASVTLAVNWHAMLT